MQKMKWGLAVMLLIPLSLQAQDDAKKEKQEAEKTVFQKIDAEYQKTYQEVISKFREAKTDEERKAIRSQFSKMNTDFLPKFLAGAKEDPASDSGFQCLVWVFQRGRSGKQFDQALELLSKHHVTHKNIGQVTSALMRSKNEKAKNFLKAIMEKHPDNAVKGRITFQFAEKMKSTAERTGDLKLYAKTERAYEDIVLEYGDVRYARGGTLAKASENALKEMRGPRALGKIAPEVEAEDLDGETFKLSDYRGKVVLIDFWGNW